MEEGVREAKALGKGWLEISREAEIMAEKQKLRSSRRANSLAASHSVRTNRSPCINCPDINPPECRYDCEKLRIYNKKSFQAENSY